MPRHSINKTVACARSTANLFTRNQADLLAKGYDAADDIVALNAGADALPVTDEAQEHAKTEQKDASTDVADETRSAYTLASTALKTASGFLGKKGTEADEARRIRNEVSNQENPVQVSAFVTSVIAFLNNHKPALLAKKFDPTAKIAELTPFATSLTEMKGHHEAMRGGRGDATTAVEGAIDDLFNSANDKLEAAIGLYPPDSEFVKEVLRIRATLRRRDPGPPTPPTPPTPPPTP